MNLLKETKENLSNHNLTPDNVLWCGSKEFGWFSWKDFEEVANIGYDDDFGAQKVAIDLVVCGKDFWLERHEYDGSEWWEFKKMPQQPNKYRKPVALTIEQAIEKGFNVSCGWESLSKINGDKN